MNKRIKKKKGIVKIPIFQHKPVMLKLNCIESKDIGNVQLYRIELPDYFCPAYCTFYNDYFGTKEEILELLSDGDDKQLYDSAVEYFKYPNNVELYCDYPNRLTIEPVKIFAISILEDAKDFSAEFYNVWGYTYSLVADSVSTEAYYVSDSDKSYAQVIKACFKNLQYDSSITELGRVNLDRYYGYPNQIQSKIVDGQNEVYNKLLIVSRRFDTKEELNAELEKDAVEVEYDRFFGDCFGDG